MSKEPAGSSPRTRVVGVVALAIGAAAACAYYLQDLTLSHYDAKAHLVVARRIVDSLRPGWMQIGAVWLPLPHLLNLIPVQVDAFYRSGVSAVALSVFGFVLGAVSLWALVVRATGSPVAAWAAFAVFAAHPDVLYLQATPMTESLLMGLCLFGVFLTWQWVVRGGRSGAWQPGVVLALACLTRYEAWPISAAASGLAALALIRLGMAPAHAAVRASILAAYPAAAVLGFMALSRATVGSWLVAGGFFEADASMVYQPAAVLRAVWLGVRRLNGDAMTLLCVLGFLVTTARLWQRRDAAHLLVPYALAACVLLPLYGFWHGHPFRIRYMVPLTMAMAVFGGLGVGLLPRRRPLAAAGLILLALVETPPLSRQSPVVIEAQRDAPKILARRNLTECLLQNYDHTPILASMASLAHYMQELARAGFAIRHFVHEGIGQLWADSLLEAGRHVSWILIEEEAEGGDVLARLMRESPDFMAGFERHCEGGGVALYRRTLSP